MSTNLHKQDYKINLEAREKIQGHQPSVVWLTGLSGSGKSTIANLLETRLFDMGYKTYVLDGDNVRMGLNKDLGFQPEDRKENIRRIGEVAALFADAGTIVISAFISPYMEDRSQVRKTCTRNFLEVHVDCSLSSCEARDPKGLYKKARAGQIKNFTGIDAPYERPSLPEILVNTEKYTVSECVDIILSSMEKRGIIPASLSEIKEKEKKKTICVDFDGVIHAYSDGFCGLENIYDGIHQGARKGLSELHSMGFKLIVMSSRPAYLIRSWLKNQALDVYISDVTNVKCPASFYIDDHALEFEKGNSNSWNNILEKIKLGENN